MVGNIDVSILKLPRRSDVFPEIFDKTTARVVPLKVSFWGLLQAVPVSHEFAVPQREPIEKKNRQEWRQLHLLLSWSLPLGSYFYTTIRDADTVFSQKSTRTRRALGDYLEAMWVQASDLFTGGGCRRSPGKCCG